MIFPYGNLEIINITMSVSPLKRKICLPEEKCVTYTIICIYCNKYMIKQELTKLYSNKEVKIKIICRRCVNSHYCKKCEIMNIVEGSCYFCKTSISS